MTLTLTVLRCPDKVAPQTKRITGGEFSVGRGSENDWVLPDPERHLSKRHCVLAFRAGYWRVLDTSANGTFHNHDEDPVGPGAGRELRDGDRLRLGPYEIEVRIAEAVAAPAYSAAQDPYAPKANPFVDDSLVGQPIGRDSAHLPSDFDPLAPDPDMPNPGIYDKGMHNQAFRGPTQSDHAPAIEDAFRMPPQAASLLPDDWDLDDQSPAQPPSLPPTPPPPLTPPPLTTTQTSIPVDPVVAPATVPDQGLWAAFLEGAEIEGGVSADPEATMRSLGRTFRATVSGLRQAIIARAEVKGEFRIERTMIRARGNNPLKFSADDDDALAALLGIGRVTDMDPARAVAEALRDLRLHELASVNAMQTAVRALLAQFEPAGLRTRAEESGGLALVPAQRKARAWEVFEKMHQDVTRALADDFDSVFGRAFARAYEQALRDISDDH
jgi:type VI secretion system protein ImpI/type VI secretion system protein